MGPLNFPKPNEVLARHLAGLAKTPQVPRLGPPGSSMHAPVPMSPWANLGKPPGPVTIASPGMRPRSGGF